MEFKDYYATLGVSRLATPEEIKKAFRGMARRYHPDVAKDKKVGEEKFKLINEAHEVLSDPVKRKRYDELGENWKEGSAPQRPPGDPSRGGYARAARPEQEFHFGGTGFSDFFEQFFAERGGTGFTGGHEEANPGQLFHGQDIEGDILVTLDEVLHGSVREISLQRNRSSQSQNAAEQFKVRIPPGILDGQRIRVPGKGGPGRGGGDPGDLYLRVRIAAHPDFRVQEADLYYDLDIAPWEGVLGAEVLVETLGGQIKVRIPSGTNNGRQLRITGHGLPKGRSGGMGDLYVHLEVQLPKTINEEERLLWEKISQVSEFHPRS